MRFTSFNLLNILAPTKLCLNRKEIKINARLLFKALFAQYYYLPNPKIIKFPGYFACDKRFGLII